MRGEEKILSEDSSLEGQRGTQMPDELNYGTMLPALGFTACDLALTMTENYGYLWR